MSLSPVRQSPDLSFNGTPLTLHQARLAAGLTQHELAYRAGIDKATVSALESGRATNPRFETMRALATVLQIDLGRLDFAIERRAPRRRIPIADRPQLRKPCRISTRVTEIEFDQIMASVQRRRLTINEWVRLILVHVATASPHI